MTVPFDAGPESEDAGADAPDAPDAGEPTAERLRVPRPGAAMPCLSVAIDPEPPPAPRPCLSPPRE